MQVNSYNSPTNLPKLQQNPFSELLGFLAYTLMNLYGTNNVRNLSELQNNPIRSFVIF
jgi:hypothetical protein